MSDLAFLPRQSGEPEADRQGEAPHPREMLSLVGHQAAEATLLQAYRSGRLPHALMLAGPRGIGKATLAYRFARFVLAHPDHRAAEVQNATSLALGATHPVAQLVASRGHPDLAVVTRGYDARTKRIRTQIGVDDTRLALETFGLTAGLGGWRICIIDAADELNKSSANAILKTLEEPPRRCLFLLVAHAPQRLLPTIRSRCRMLRLSALATGDVGRITLGLGGPYAELDASAHELAAARSEGSVAQALAELDPGAMRLRELIEKALAALPGRDPLALEALAQTVANRDGDTGFALLIDAVERWLAARLAAGLDGPVSRLAPLPELWNKLSLERRDVDALNLDRRPFVMRLFVDLADVARRTG